MSLVKWKKDDFLFPSFPSLLDDVFEQDYFNKIALGTNIPAVNIKENEKEYTIHFGAPGLTKEDFKISLDHNLLSISSEKKTEKTDEKEKYTRREYSFSSFSRSFSLPNNVNSDKIDANYLNGELIITIPKKEIETKVIKQIAIK
ncbi:MAG: Hsp20/alpha crystallin family protein [Chitinophagaceae bacterium]|nr:Hsp20/alpha crystallin family protein [Chitinophagaceae bacterium]